MLKNKKNAFITLLSITLAVYNFINPQKQFKAAETDIQVDVYNPDKACNGTTILADNHIPEKPRVIEVDMEGRIVWEYLLPAGLKRYTNPGFDVEALSNGNVLLTLPGKGLYEINREGNVVWSYLDKKVSHDADRLPNKNTLVVYGNDDTADDAQVKEISPQGALVWTWYAKDHFYKSPYKNISRQGWTHTNAASRLTNGNTLISLRNFNIVVEVGPKGKVIRIIGQGIYNHQHDPEILPNGNILTANHGRPQAAEEMNPETEEIIWQFALNEPQTWPVRDADRLTNGNTLITGTTKIVEVTPEKEIVWQLSLKGLNFGKKDGPARGFYKAQRISP
ncbi:MAG: aryl-sulfate sulfotransferase [Candidatus Omnitrophica bacterium]|nr:aryl-sulfate sulfotransferase [Candidatus Omnitrophota bacterium]